MQLFKPICHPIFWIGGPDSFEHACDLHGMLSESMSENDEYAAKILFFDAQAAHCTARCVARHPILHGSLMQQQANDNGQQTQNKQALHANSITLLQNLEFLNAAEQDVAVGLAAFILHRLSSYRRNLLSIFTIVTRIMQKPLLHSHGR